MTTADILITILGVALAAGVGNIMYTNRRAADERKQDRERLIRIETRLEGLDSMRSEIKSNADNIRVLDKALSKVEGRLTFVEKALESFKAFCSKQHNVDLGNL